MTVYPALGLWGEEGKSERKVGPLGSLNVWRCGKRRERYPKRKAKDNNNAASLDEAVVDEAVICC